MLQSILRLKRIYEKRGGKVQKKAAKNNILRFPARNTNILHFPNSQKSYIRSYELGLEHFGVFSGDGLTIERGKTFLSVQSNSLYAVQLPDDSIRICAVKYEGFETTLHDGRGGNFKKYRTAFLVLIGEVVGIERGAK